MNRLARISIGHQSLTPPSCESELAGRAILFDPAGAMILPEHGLLCISDLHLEKGAAFARRGQLLPPWDTLATLRILESVIARHNPKIVVSLGDNFHDRTGSVHMPVEFRLMINAMARGREWIWINGNHDPDGVTDLAGISAMSRRRRRRRARSPATCIRPPRSGARSGRCVAPALPSTAAV